MIDETNAPARVRWARLRFSIIAQLFTSPPPEGELQAAILELASRQWRHPSTNEVLRSALIDGLTIRFCDGGRPDEAVPVKAA